MSTKQYAGLANADYGKMTVTKLREVLRSRSIPLTGLTRKQHFIDRLVQEDARQTEDLSLVVPTVSAAVSPEEASDNSNQNTSTQLATDDADDLVKGTPSAVLQAEHAAYATDPQPATSAIGAVTETGMPSETCRDSGEEMLRTGTANRNLDGDRKRKRQDHTPPMVTEGEVQKKLKSDENQSIIHQPGLSKDAVIAGSENDDHTSLDLVCTVDETVDTQSALMNNANLDADAALPSLHPVTAALYIRNLKRPLQLPAFRQHLETLARDDNPILSLHLDVIRTHAFVLFSSSKIASRVRAGLHKQMWPAERDREPLWVDFIPEDKLAMWIETETTTAPHERSSPARRWEVVYDTLEDGSIITTLRDTLPNSSAPLRHHSQAQSPLRRESMDGHQDSAPLMQAAPEQLLPSSTSFFALDELFRSTRAKPKLYWLPVKSHLVDSRLDEIDALTTKTRSYPKSGSGLQDSRRYTFENGDRLVDNGPEFGLRGTRLARGDSSQARGQLRPRSGDRWH